MVLPRDDAPSSGLPPTSNATPPPERPLSPLIAPPKSSPGALAYRRATTLCRVSHVSHKSSNGRGGILFYPSRARTDAPLRSRRVSEIGRDTRHARHPTPPDTTDIGRHATLLCRSRGGAARGELLGFSAREGRRDPRRVRGRAGGRVDRYHPESRKGPTQKLPAAGGSLSRWVKLDPDYPGSGVIAVSEYAIETELGG